MLKKRILSIVLALTMLMVPGAYAAQPAKDDMRGVWVASVHNIDFPSEQGMTADQLKASSGHHSSAFADVSADAYREDAVL